MENEAVIQRAKLYEMDLLDGVVDLALGNTEMFNALVDIEKIILELDLDNVLAMKVNYTDPYRNGFMLIKQVLSETKRYQEMKKHMEDMEVIKG
jgi:hypothetical protein